jgi:hypothetical protein
MEKIGLNLYKRVVYDINEVKMQERPGKKEGRAQMEREKVKKGRIRVMDE